MIARHHTGKFPTPGCQNLKPIINGVVIEAQIAAKAAKAAKSS